MKRNRDMMGYTLVEMAIVMAIISVVVGMSVSAGMTQMEIARNGSTKSALENVREALLVYHKKRGRLPCPADPTATPSDVGYGVEVNNGSCSSGCDALNLNCIGEAVAGAVPFKTLKLNADSTIDAWDNKVTYVVDKDFTSLTGNSYYAPGTITVQDTNGADVTASPSMGDAYFVLISHGEDGSGAYVNETGQQRACVAGHADSTNCDYADDIFVDDRLNNHMEVIANYFDDIVVWQAQENLDIENPFANAQNCNKPLAAGQRIACAINEEGTPYCWGDNTQGSFGTGATIASNAPIQAFGGGTDWVSFSTNISNGIAGHTCGVRTSGALYCAGNNSSGQLGTGTTTPSTVPIQESSALTNWKEVDVGDAHTCAMKIDGRLFCWGSNTSGQIGSSVAASPQLSPIEVAGTFTDWTDFTVGAAHSCGIRNNGEAYCWGENGSNQLGDGTTNDSSIPVLVGGGGSNWVKIDSSNEHTCGITQSAQAYCWGRGTFGRLGNNLTANAATPDIVQGGYTDWTDISAGYSATCGLRSGHLWCWGNRADYVIPDGGATSGTQMTPVEETGLFDDWVGISLEWENACAIRTGTGKFYCWGANDFGQIGNGTTATPATTPVEVTVISACEP